MNMLVIFSSNINFFEINDISLRRQAWKNYRDKNLSPNIFEFIIFINSKQVVPQISMMRVNVTHIAQSVKYTKEIAV